MGKHLCVDGTEFVVDDVDDPFARSLRWYAHRQKNKLGEVRNVYVVAGRWPTTVRLHRFLTEAPAGLDVDHIDGNGLNNRRDNLRLVSRGQNNHNRRRQSNNTSGFKGVWFHPLTGRWQASVRVAGKAHYGGLFDTPQEADLAARALREKLHAVEYVNHGEQRAVQKERT